MIGKVELWKISTENFYPRKEFCKFIFAEEFLKLNPIVSKKFKNVEELIIKMKKGEYHKARLQVVNGFTQQIWVINQKKNFSKNVDKYFFREDFCRENEDSNIIKEEPEEILLEDEEKLKDQDDKPISIKTVGERKHDK